jgi:carbamoyl-phosphate synthase small subunit
LILKIRNDGAMMGRLSYEKEIPQLKELPHDMVTTVSCKQPEVYGDGAATLAVMDYGIKEGILRSLAGRGCRLVRFPNTTAAEDVLSLNPDGLVLSNGPGDPAVLDYEVAQVRRMLGQKPLLGVCLGNQLLARACGAKTHKLSFGHRGANQPVEDVRTGRGILTSQNHQYAVSEDTLAGTGLEVAYRHLGDGTIEGLRHRELGALSVQFHPEASPGPEDARYIFDDFIETVKLAKEAAR